MSNFEQCDTIAMSYALLHTVFHFILKGSSDQQKHTLYLMKCDNYHIKNVQTTHETDYSVTIWSGDYL